MLNLLGRSIPYFWILFNLYLFYKSYLLNNYKFFGSEQMRMLEHSTIVYPFQSTNIIHYDISELLFSCVIPVYIYILLTRLVVSFIAKN